MTSWTSMVKKRDQSVPRGVKFETSLRKTSSSDIERIFKLNPDDPEYIKEMQRPAVIKQDLSDMERRKRVHQVLNSKEFCSQLESVIKWDAFDNITDDELKDLNRCNQIAYLSTNPYSFSCTPNFTSRKNSLLPVADMGVSKTYDKCEIKARNKLASLCRLIDYFNWNCNLENHLSFKLSTVSDCDNQNDKEICLLINSIDLMLHEVTASSLIRINTKNYIIDGGSSRCGINASKYALQAAIYEAREDINCIVHLQIPIVTAVSSTKIGLLPICQEAMVIGEISYHDCIDYSEIEKNKINIAKDLGKNNILMLRNNGFIVCGATIEETMFLVYNTVIACESMFKALRIGLDNIVLPNQVTVKKVYDEVRYKHRVLTKELKDNVNDSTTTCYKIGELEWDAWMRVLDCIGHKTGHIYSKNNDNTKEIISKKYQFNNINNDIMIPPASISSGKIDESDNQSLAAYKISLLKKEQEKLKWLNSPNVYQKIKLLEKGVENPKIITKWICDVNHESGIFETPIALKQSCQFIKPNLTDKEFKTKQKEMKEIRLQGAKSAGPQSQILDIGRIENASNCFNNKNGENFDNLKKPINVGSASKGIIDKNYQFHGQIYSQVYSPNPFNKETDKSLQSYIEYCNKKTEEIRIRKEPARKVESFDKFSDCDDASLMEAVQEYRRSINSPQTDEETVNNGNCNQNKTKQSLQDTSNIISTNEKSNNFSRIFNKSSSISKSDKNQSPKKEKKVKKKRLSIFSFGKKKISK